MTPLAATAPALLLALLVAAGLPLARRLPGGAGHRLAMAVIAGAVGLHLALTALQLVAGARWTPWLIAAPLLVAAAAGLLPGGAPAPRRPPFGWGDGVALVALLAFAVLAWLLPILNSDFIYHWGIKGHRFALAGGVDYAFLARPWNWLLHPDYPQLFPELYAATALLGGGWHEPPQMLWSVALFALLLLCLREILASGELSPFARYASFAALALAVAAFAIRVQMAGSADWGPALAIAAAAPALMRPPDGRGDLQIGLCAAFAAAAKMEGVPLAAILVGVQLLRRLQRRAWPSVAGAAALLLPALLVVGPWLATVVRYDLFQRFNAGSFAVDKALSTAVAIGYLSFGRDWHGLALAVVLLPALLLAPRLRPLAAVLLLQLGFYLWTYVTADVGTLQLVVSSYSRLLLHLLPTALAAAACEGLAADPAAPAAAAAAPES